MNKIINVNIVNKDCKGIYLFTDSDVKEITSIKQANSLIGSTFKLQLKTRVEGRLSKKTFTYEIKKKSFVKAVEDVASKRESIRAIVKDVGTLKPKRKNTKSIEQKDTVTLLDMIEVFMETKEISARASTLQNYNTALMTHCKSLHNKLIVDITLNDFQKLINGLTKTKAPATVELFGRTIKTFIKKQKLDIDIDDLELPEVDNVINYTLGLDDTKKIIKAMREYSKIDIDGEVYYQYPEVRNVFAFLLSGRRISEVLNLKYSDINFEAETFTLPSHRVKGKKELNFNLDNYLLEAIYLQAKENNVKDVKTSDCKIFTYTKETPRVHYQSLLKALGLPKLRLHDIRHMLGSTLVQNGTPIADISVMLGHSSIAITEQRYANTNKDQASRATDALDKLINE
jgi:integrase